MRQVVAALGLVWALLNLIVAAFFMKGSFTATTAAKEGIAAQLALLIGGLLIGVFALMLARGALTLFVRRTGQ
jgi:ABC-type polysaccharide/polyol phosphate export permease